MQSLPFHRGSFPEEQTRYDDDTVSCTVLYSIFAKITRMNLDFQGGSGPFGGKNGQNFVKKPLNPGETGDSINIANKLETKWEGKTMKFLHCSDLHLGRALHNYPLLKDQRYILEQILNLAQEHQADALLIAGDVYDRSTPSGEAVALLDWFLTQAAELGLPCFLTAGNHDSAERVAYGGALMRNRGIYLSPVLSGGLEPISMEDEWGTVDVYLLPFLKTVHVRALWPEELENTTQAVQAVLEHSPRNPEHRQVLVAHQFVTSGGTNPILCDSESPSVGGLNQVDVSAFEGFDYVALGHIHSPQPIGRDTVRYSGSPLKYSTSEWEQVKSVALVTLGEKGNVEVELLPLKPLHDLRRIEGAIEKLLDPAVVAQGDRQDYIHAIYTDQNPMNPLERIQQVYPNVVKVEPKNWGGMSEDLPQVEAQQRQSMTQLFAEFFTQQTGETLTEEEKNWIADLLQEEDEDK
jgi:exonuclease SbcD